MSIFVFSKNLKIFNVDELFKIIFRNVLDPQVLLLNKNKFTIGFNDNENKFVLFNKSKILDQKSDNDFINEVILKNANHINQFNFNIIKAKIPLFKLPKSLQEE